MMLGFGKKQVLLVGNDGVQLYMVSGKRVSLYSDFSQSGFSLSSDLRKAFKDINAPLTVLFDVIEQQYRKESIPKVGFSDKNKVIQRKLQMALPQVQMRAFYPLKTPPKQGESMVALFAGLTPNLTVTQVMDAVLGSEVKIQGAALLPLEAMPLVQRLSDAFRKRAKGSAQVRWSVLMTYHKTGGLRQVIVKDGELALTRLTPLAVDSQDTVALTEEMVREFNATLTYLSRFGYAPAEGIELIVISSDDICRTIQNYSLQVTKLHAVSLHEAGRAADISPAKVDEESVYADSLHAGWVGAQKKLVMPLSSPLLQKVTQARRMAEFAIFLLILGLGYLVWQVVTVQSDIVNTNKEILDLKSKKISLQADHDALAQKLNTLKHDPEKIKTIIQLNDRLTLRDIDSEKLIDIVNAVFPKDKMILRNIDITPGDAASSTMPKDFLEKSDSDIKDKGQVMAKLKIAFPDSIAVEAAANETNAFADVLKSRLPDWDIIIDEMVGNLALDATVQGVSEQVGEGKVEGRVVKKQTSTIIMKGVLK